MAATSGSSGPLKPRARRARAGAESGSEGQHTLKSAASGELREILITVSPIQFETFARDLKLLRAHGAESNTRAIIDAVRERAARVRVVAVDERKAV